MKILLLISDMDVGGAQTHVYELACALKDRGHEVCVASGGGRLASALETRGTEHVTLPLGSRSVGAILRCRVALERLIRSQRFDIVHAHSRIAAFVADDVCKRLDVCFVTTIHARFKMTPTLRRLSRWGNATVAVGRDLYYYLLKNAPEIAHGSVRVIGNGVDTVSFCPSESRQTGHIVFLSRLDADCSSVAYALCRVAPRLCQKYPDMRISIGGGGTELEGVRRAAETANKAMGRGMISVLGRVDDTVSLLQSADIFVGVSRAALEAMSCGAAVVLAGDEGYLGVAKADVIRMAEHTNLCCRGERGVSDHALLSDLSELLGMDEQRRRALGEYLREYAAEHHSIRSSAEKTEEFYLDALRKHRRGGNGTLLCGYYGFGNLGDELLCEGALGRAYAQKESGARILARKSGKQSVKRSDPIAVARAIKEADRVVFGGGTLLQNATSHRSLWYYLAILRLAQMMGKRTELWANGIGEIKGRLDRRIAAEVLCACDRVGLRDAESVRATCELAEEHGKALKEVLVERDLALEKSFAEDNGAEYILHSSGVMGEQRIAVIALRGTEKKGYLDAARQLARKLSESGVRPVFAVMYPEQDLRISERMCEELGGVLAYPATADDIVGIMKRAQVVCGMRYHALVLAHVAGTPFVGIGGEPKIRSFCRSSGGVYFEDVDIGK